jgi:hypothetical protein
MPTAQPSVAETIDTEFKEAWEMDVVAVNH